MNVDNRQEMAERFRLYGEIFMLCVDIAGKDNIEDFELSFDDLYDTNGVMRPDVVTDDGDMSTFDGIRFEDMMLWIDYNGNTSIPFIEVESNSLTSIFNFVYFYKIEDHHED